MFSRIIRRIRARRRLNFLLHALNAPHFTTWLADQRLRIDFPTLEGLACDAAGIYGCPVIVPMPPTYPTPPKVEPLKPAIGRVVHVTLDKASGAKLGGNHNPDSDTAISIAPATIVRVWSDTCINVKVHGDSPNDMWMTSVLQDEADLPQPLTWHWPKRV